MSEYDTLSIEELKEELKTRQFDHWWLLGRRGELDNISFYLRNKAGKFFIEGNDKSANLYRNLADEIPDKLKPEIEDAINNNQKEIQEIKRLLAQREES